MMKGYFPLNQYEGNYFKCVKSSPSEVKAKCAIYGYGYDSVSIEREEAFPTSFEEVTINGNVFVKFPKFYFTLDYDRRGAIGNCTIATYKVDEGYDLYPCFKKYNGLVETGEEADYILVGKYCCSSRDVANSVNASPMYMLITDFRNNARALGAGYQSIDWKIQRLLQDLMICVTGGYSSGSFCGIEHLNYPTWIDGISCEISGSSAHWNIAYDPSKYIGNATQSSVGYKTPYMSCNTGYNKKLSDMKYGDIFENFATSIEDYGSFGGAIGTISGESNSTPTQSIGSPFSFECYYNGTSGSFDATRLCYIP